MPSLINRDVAERLDEVAVLLESQHASRFRVAAYRQAAETVRRLPTPVADILRREGLAGLVALPHVGESLARAIRDLIERGRLPMLDRLRGDSDPAALLATVPGVGRRTADVLYHDLGLESLEDLEVAAYDGRLSRLARLGPKRLAGIRAALAQRLARVTVDRACADEPPVEELLDVDREFREKASAGELPTIAPRRFNPRHVAWLPILHTTRGHTTRGPRHYTALFSNTALAHRLGRTDDWVVLYWDDGRGTGQATVVTARGGPWVGERVVRGRESELPGGRPIAWPATRPPQAGDSQPAGTPSRVVESKEQEACS